LTLRGGIPDRNRAWRVVKATAEEERRPVVVNVVQNAAPKK
jgi:hypothetical protein